MRQLFLCFFFFYIWESIVAQNADSTRNFRYVLGFTPSAILNYDAGIQFSHDFIFKDKNFLGLETGFIVGVKELESDFGSGYRLRFRVGWLQNSKVKKEYYFFYNYKSIFYKINREEPRANGAFIEIVTTNRHYTFKGPGFGMNFFLNDIFKAGFGAGIGVLSNTYDPPIDSQPQLFSGFSRTQEGSIHWPIFFFHINANLNKVIAHL